MPTRLILPCGLTLNPVDRRRMWTGCENGVASRSCVSVCVRACAFSVSVSILSQRLPWPHISFRDDPTPCQEKKLTEAKKRAEERAKWGRTAHRGALMAAEIPHEKKLAVDIAEACLSHN